MIFLFRPAPALRRLAADAKQGVLLRIALQQPCRGLFMIFLKFFCGILFFTLGWMFLFKSTLILTINRIAREMVFNDRLILLGRKKLAILFFCLSFVALHMGFSALTQFMASRDRDSWTQETTR